MYPEEIMQALRQASGLAEDDTSQDAHIANMQLRDVLDAYLQWEGVIGYTDNIMAIVIGRLKKVIIVASEGIV